VSDKLAGVHPKLAARARQIQMTMTGLGFVMIVTDGVRTVEEQQKLYAQGRTAPGKIVTNADGVRNKSNHQVKADGFGHAVDMTFLDRNGRPSWDESYPWALYGELAKALGLKWGGDWTSPDRPHIELPEVS